jgi:hypothetical protein
VYGKKKHVHNSSNNPPKFSLYYSRRRILEKTISKTLKRKRMKMMNERERESEKSSSITLAQDMVVGSEERDLFILGEANLPLLDQCQLSNTKQKMRSLG